MPEVKVSRKIFGLHPSDAYGRGMPLVVDTGNGTAAEFIVRPPVMGQSYLKVIQNGGLLECRMMFEPVYTRQFGCSPEAVAEDADGREVPAGAAAAEARLTGEGISPRPRLRTSKWFEVDRKSVV